MGSIGTTVPLRTAASTWICSACRRQASQRASPSKHRPNQQISIGWSRNTSTATIRASSLKHESHVAVFAPSEEDTPASLAPVRELFRDQLRVSIGDDAQQPDDPYGLLAALRGKDFDGVNAAVTRSFTDPTYFRKIPKSTWTEIFRILTPTNTLLPLHRIHNSFNTRQLAQVDFKRSDRVAGYLDSLMHIIRLRRENGAAFNIVDYQILLQHAAMIGHEPTARVFWNYMRRDGIQPDRLCYNAFLEASVWNEKSRRKRWKRLKPPKWAKGEHPPNDTGLFFDEDIAATVHRVAEEMTAAKVLPDTDTYCAMIAGLARGGDVDGIWAILLNAWGVEADALNGDFREIVPSFTVSPGAPTYPNQALLITLADAFGSMNQIITSVNLVVFFCHRYGLEMPLSAWYQISKWIWLQSRVKPEDRENTSAETLPAQSIEDTARIMQHTFGMEPSQEQLNVFFQSQDNPFRHSLSLAQRLELLEAGIDRYRSQLQQYKFRMRWNPQNFNIKDEQLQTRARMSHQLLQRWCRSLINSTGTPDSKGEGNKHLHGWRLRGVPHLLLQYSDFCPRLVRYSVNTGLVALRFRTTKDIRVDQLRKLVKDGQAHAGTEAAEQQDLEASIDRMVKSAPGGSGELPAGFWQSSLPKTTT